MPRPQRAATVLVTLNGLSESEAAGVLGVARSTLRRYAHTGLAELQVALIAAGYCESHPGGQVVSPVEG